MALPHFWRLKEKVPSEIRLPLLMPMNVFWSFPNICFSSSFSESTLSEQGELKPLSTSPEHQGSQGSPSPSPQSSNFQPIMSILGGVATALVLVTVVIIVTMRLRCSGLRHHHTPNGSHDHTWKTDSGCENSSVGGAPSGDNSVSDLQQQHSTTDMGFLRSRSGTVTFFIYFLWNVRLG